MTMVLGSERIKVIIISKDEQQWERGTMASFYVWFFLSFFLFPFPSILLESILALCYAITNDGRMALKPWDVESRKRERERKRALLGS